MDSRTNYACSYGEEDLSTGSRMPVLVARAIQNDPLCSVLEAAHGIAEGAVPDLQDHAAPTWLGIDAWTDEAGGGVPNMLHVEEN